MLALRVSRPPQPGCTGLLYCVCRWAQRAPRGDLGRLSENPGPALYLSLSRLNHWLPWGQAHPEVMQGTADLHHQIADPFFPQAEPIFDDATTLDTAINMLNPEATGVERLVDPLLL